MNLREANKGLEQRLDFYAQGNETFRVIRNQIKHDDRVFSNLLFGFGIFTSLVVLSGLGYVIYAFLK